MTKSNILIIDDNVELHNLIRIGLEQNGHAGFNSSNGQEAMHLLRTKKADTVLRLPTFGAVL